MNTDTTNETIIAATQTWVERAVIGLNLCPFAKSVHVKKQIRYVVSEATTPDSLLTDLMRELELLAEANPEKIDMTLFIHPYVLQDFLDYNDFLDVVDETLEELKLDGILQIATMHPQYQFADTEPDDITNYTNRSPYPTLHLLREASIEQAVAGYPDTDKIFERNIETMHRLGHEGWDALQVTAPKLEKP